MNPLRLTLYLLVGSIATTAGGLYSAALPDDLLAGPAVTPRRPAPSQTIEHQSTSLPSAIATLKRLGLAEEASLDEPSAKEEEKPETPIEAVLAEALIAIVKDSNGYAALLLDVSTGERTRRVRGQPFKDGWTFGVVAPSEIALKKGKETKTIPVMLKAPAPAAPPGSGDPP